MMHSMRTVLMVVITLIGLASLSYMNRPGRFEGYWFPVLSNAKIESMTILDPRTLVVDISFTKNRDCDFQNVFTYFEYENGSNVWYWVPFKQNSDGRVFLPTGRFRFLWVFDTDASKFLGHRLKIETLHHCYGNGQYMTDTIQIVDPPKN